MLVKILVGVIVVLLGAIAFLVYALCVMREYIESERNQ